MLIQYFTTSNYYTWRLPRKICGRYLWLWHCSQKYWCFGIMENEIDLSTKSDNIYNDIEWNILESLKSSVYLFTWRHVSMCINFGIFIWKKKFKSSVCGNQMWDLLLMFSNRQWTIHFEIQTWNGMIRFPQYGHQGYGEYLSTVCLCHTYNTGISVCGWYDSVFYNLIVL